MVTVVSGTKCKTLLNIFISEKEEGKEREKNEKATRSSNR
jgi:hypothetical protein